MMPNAVKVAFRDADTDHTMNTHMRALRQLIQDGMYAIDERAVADAIVARAVVHLTVAGVSFRTEVRGPSVRSFRRDEHVRSFRLERTARLHRAR